MDTESGKGRSSGIEIAKNFYRILCRTRLSGSFCIWSAPWDRHYQVEAPWVETSSDYRLKPNMTYQIDTFISTATFGVRWEKGIAVTETGCEVLSPEIGTLYELEF